MSGRMPEIPGPSLQPGVDQPPDERKDALEAVAAELERRVGHFEETIRWVKSDDVRVADYLGAVAHGLRLGALAARSRS